jgi:hypothetical protein
MDDDELLAYALATSDDATLLDMAISRLLAGLSFDSRHALWLAQKLIQIQEYSHPKTALSARKLFGLKGRENGDDRHGATQASADQLVALRELMYRRLGKAESADAMVASVCCISREALKQAVKRAGLLITSMREFDDELLLSIAGSALLKRLP